MFSLTPARLARKNRAARRYVVAARAYNTAVVALVGLNADLWPETAEQLTYERDRARATMNRVAVNLKEN